jgi:hypothetical protein
MAKRHMSLRAGLNAGSRKRGLPARHWSGGSFLAERAEDTERRFSEALPESPPSSMPASAKLEANRELEPA